MPIPVTCPGCYSRFTVSDKFAGKKGPCPKCKKEISIPLKSEEVVIHAPEPEGPKDSQGKVILKPIRRTETNLSLGMWFAIGGVALFFLLGAILLRFSPTTTQWALGIGAVLLAPPLVLAGYQFLRNDELEGYRGKDLWIRTLICSTAFAATWGIYVFLAYYFEFRSLPEVSAGMMAVFMVGMVAIGGFTSLATFELEMWQSLLHYMLYLVLSFLLSCLAGLAIAEPLAGVSNQPAAASPASGRPSK